MSSKSDKVSSWSSRGVRGIARPLRSKFATAGPGHGSESSRSPLDVARDRRAMSQWPRSGAAWSSSSRTSWVAFPGVRASRPSAACRASCASSLRSGEYASPSRPPDIVPEGDRPKARFDQPDKGREGEIADGDRVPESAAEDERQEVLTERSLVQRPHRCDPGTQMRLRACRIEAERRRREHCCPAYVGLVADAFDRIMNEAFNRAPRSTEHDLNEGRKYSLVQLRPILDEVQDDGRHVARQILAAGDAVCQAGMLPARSVVQLRDDFTVQDVPRLFRPAPGEVIEPAGELVHLHCRVGSRPRRLPRCELRSPFRITPRFDADATEPDAVGLEDCVPIPWRAVRSRRGSVTAPEGDQRVAKGRRRFIANQEQERRKVRDTPNGCSVATQGGEGSRRSIGLDRPRPDPFRPRAAGPARGARPR